MKKEKRITKNGGQIDYNKLSQLTVAELEEFITKRLRDGSGIYISLDEYGRAEESRYTIFSIICDNYKESEFVQKFLKTIDNIIGDVFLKFDWKNITKKEIKYFSDFCNVCLNAYSYYEDVIGDDIEKVRKDTADKWKYFVNMNSPLIGIKDKNDFDVYGYALAINIFFNKEKKFWLPFIEADEKGKILFDGKYTEEAFRALKEIDFDDSLNYFETVFKYHKKHPKNSFDTDYIVFCVAEELIEKRNYNNEQIKDVIRIYLKEDEFYNRFCKKVNGYKW